jgi:hypothetical protein
VAMLNAPHMTRTDSLRMNKSDGPRLSGGGAAGAAASNGSNSAHRGSGSAPANDRDGHSGHSGAGGGSSAGAASSSSTSNARGLMDQCQFVTMMRMATSLSEYQLMQLFDLFGNDTAAH